MKRAKIIETADQPGSRPAPSESDVSDVQKPAPRRKKQVSEVQSTKDREHSKISPSNLKDLEICPSKIEDKNKPKHPITIQGERCHEGLEKENWQTLEDPEDRKMCEMAQAYTDQVLAAYREKTGKEPAVFSETKLTLPNGIWGFADKLILTPDLTCADLIDYKFATQLQEDAETNPQGEAYALGIFHRFPKCQDVFVSFVYPRLGKISQAHFKRSDMTKMELRISVVVERVRAGGIFNPHPDVCMYCSRKGSCEALLRVILPVAKRYDDGHDKVLPAMPDFSLVRDPEKWQVLLSYAPILEDAASSIKRHAVQFHKDTGQEIPGFDMVEREGRRKIHSALLAWEVAKKSGIDQKAFLQTVDVSVSQLLAAAADLAPKGMKKEARERLENELRDAGVLEVGEPIYFMKKQKEQ